MRHSRHSLNKWLRRRTGRWSSRTMLVFGVGKRTRHSQQTTLTVTSNKGRPMAPPLLPLHWCSAKLPRRPDRSLHSAHRHVQNRLLARPLPPGGNRESPLLHLHRPAHPAPRLTGFPAPDRWLCPALPVLPRLPGNYLLFPPVPHPQALDSTRHRSGRLLADGLVPPPS